MDTDSISATATTAAKVMMLVAVRENETGRMSMVESFPRALRLALRFACDHYHVVVSVAVVPFGSVPIDVRAWQWLCPREWLVGSEPIPSC